MTQATVLDRREPNNDRQERSLPETRAHLLSTLAVIEFISTRGGGEHLSRQLRDLRERIEQNQFRLAVVGQFKRGKTSLLNALLGETDLLPVGALPFTSVLTIVTYGRQSGGKVVFQSGTRLSISLAEIKDYVTEAGNPNNCKMVEEVEVFYPGEILRGGISLVNSPGFGSLSDQNTVTAYGYLPRIDAAVFVTSPDPPLTAAEMEFLKKLFASTRKVFAVMNKIDLLERSSWSDVIEFTREAITRIVGDRSTALYAVSALRAASSQQENSIADLSGLQGLESDIREFLSTDRDETFLTSVRQSLFASISDLRLDLESQIASATTSLQDSERKRIHFERELSAVRDQHAQNERALLEMVNRLADLAENETVRFAESKLFAFDSPLRAFLRDNGEMPKAQLAGALDKFIAPQIENLLDCWLQELEVSLIGIVSDAVRRFLQSTNDVVASVHDRGLEQFGVQLGCNSIVEGLPTFSARREHKIGSAAPHRPRAQLLFPRPLLQWLLLRQAQAEVRRKLPRIGQAIARDLNARMRVEIRTFADNVHMQLQERIERFRAEVSTTLDKHEHSAAFNSERIAQLSADIRTLDELTETLNAGLGIQHALEA